MPTQPITLTTERRNRVTVVSVHAMVAGHARVTWTGDMVLPIGDADTVNEYLFAMFNGAGITLVGGKVPPMDLQAIGYTLPSLSMGDLVHWDSVTYRLASNGFERVTGNSDLIWRALGA